MVFCSLFFQNLDFVLTGSSHGAEEMSAPEPTTSNIRLLQQLSQDKECCNKKCNNKYKCNRDKYSNGE